MVRRRLSTHRQAGAAASREDLARVHDSQRVQRRLHRAHQPHRRLAGLVDKEALHGIGLHKQGFLLDETGEEAVALMRAVKAALDPLGILNPGKIFS